MALIERLCRGFDFVSSQITARARLSISCACVPRSEVCCAKAALAANRANARVNRMLRILVTPSKIPGYASLPACLTSITRTLIEDWNAGRDAYPGANSLFQGVARDLNDSSRKIWVIDVLNGLAVYRSSSGRSFIFAGGVNAS